MCTPVPLPARGIHVWEACVGLKAHSRGEEGLVLLDRVLLGVSPRGVLGSRWTRQKDPGCSWGQQPQGQAAWSPVPAHAGLSSQEPALPT